MRSWQPMQKPANSFLLILGIVFTLALSPLAHAAKIKLKKLPDSLDRHGLVVIQLGPTLWNNATVELSRGKDSNAHDGFFIEKLKPGKYTLESVARVTGGDYSSFMGTSITTTTYAKLPIQREFTIEAGKITHLGLLYFVQQPGEKSEEGAQVFVLPLSNAGPEQRYLQKYYPTLAATLSPADVIVPEYDYVNGKLADIRKIVYALNAKDGFKLKANGLDLGRLPILFSQSGWAFGDLGIAARPENGKVTILKNDSVDRLSHVGTLGGEEWFFSQAGAPFHTSGNTLVEAQSIPDDFFVSTGLKLGSNSMALVDNQFNILVSKDSGQSWSQTSDYSIGTKRVLDVSYSLTGDRAYIMGRDHTLFSKKGHVVIVDRATGNVAPFEAPPKILKNMVAAFETDAGMFVQTVGGSTPTTLHFRRNGTDEWVDNEILTFRNCKVSIPSPSAEQIDAICAYGRVRVVSRDLGQTWHNAQPVLSSNQEKTTIAGAGH